MAAVGRPRELEGQIKYYLEQAQVLLEQLKDESKTKRKKTLVEMASRQARAAITLITLGND